MFMPAKLFARSAGFARAGFTLIELLVVVLIAGLLAGVALPQYVKTVERSRAAEALVVGRALQDAQRRYYMANAAFSADLEELDVTVPQKSYYTFHIGTGGLIKAWHPAKDLFFEFSTDTVWSGIIFCAAAEEDEALNNLCKTFSQTFSHKNGPRNYYRLN